MAVALAASVAASSHARQVDAEGRALARFAVDVDEAVVLLDDAVDGGQAQARALADALGREERLEDVAPASRASIPQPSSLTASITKFARNGFRMLGAVLGVDDALSPSRW